jgi:hypothetical protein
MSLKKFLIIVSIVTVIAVIYVYQQSKIIQMAYQEQERLALLNSLIDKNNKLRYDINCQMSLVSLSGLWQDSDFEWPHQKQLVNLSTVGQIPENVGQTEQVDNIFTRLFGLKSKAEATPLKPR